MRIIVDGDDFEDDNDDIQGPISMEEDEDNGNNETASTEEEMNTRTRRPKCKVFFDLIMKFMNKCYKRFKDLKQQQQISRARELLVLMLAMCVEKEQMKNLCFKYLIGNTKLIKDVLTIIDFIKLEIRIYMKVDASHIDNTDVIRHPNGFRPEDWV